VKKEKRAKKEKRKRRGKLAAARRNIRYTEKEYGKIKEDVKEG
jgi:hypothetical protein